MSNSYKSVTTVCPQPSPGQNTQDIDDSLDACLDTLEVHHKMQKVCDEPNKNHYANKERAFLFDELFDDLIEKYVDNGFFTKNNRIGFFRALLPNIRIKKRKQHTHDDMNKPGESELEED